MEQTITDYLTTLNIPVSRRFFRKRVASHPDYPSLLSISDTLKQLGISHGVARLEKEQLGTLTFPYVLHMDKGSGEFLVVHGEQDLKKQTDLLKDWSGIVVQAEAPKVFEDEENREWLGKEKASRFAGGLFLLSVLVMIAMGWVQSFSWGSAFLLTTSAAGAVLGYLLVAKDLGVKYVAVESFCNAGRSINCDRVLRSDEATLFVRFSLSDAVLSYFAAQLTVAGLLIPLAGNVAPLWWSLAAVGILTLPVVAYSLWLQGAKFKTWCRLCLLVAAVLIVQAGLFGWIYTADIFDLSDGRLWAAGGVGGLFLAAGSLIFLLKARLKEGSEAEQAEAVANRIKYNPSVFTHLLLQQPQADCTPFDQELLIGKPDAPVKLTMAASLGCGPCKEGFEKAVQLVKRYPEYVNLAVRFLMHENNSNGQETDPERYILGYWLQSVAGKENESDTTEILIRDWYTLTDLNRFREIYAMKINGPDSKTGSLIGQHINWFEQEEIKATPTFYLNGYILPAGYRIEDIMMLFPGLPEQLPHEILCTNKRQAATPVRK